VAHSSVVPKQAGAKDGHWKVWENFVATFEGVDPYLEGEPQSVKLSFLKVFATRIRSGAIAPSGQPVQGRTVEDYLWTIGEEIALDDDSALDPQYSNTGRLHPAISKLQSPTPKMTHLRQESNRYRYHLSLMLWQCTITQNNFSRPSWT
jgi:hypothetical protein